MALPSTSGPVWKVYKTRDRERICTLIQLYNSLTTTNIIIYILARSVIRELVLSVNPLSWQQSVSIVMSTTVNAVQNVVYCEGHSHMYTGLSSIQFND